MKNIKIYQQVYSVGSNITDRNCSLMPATGSRSLTLATESYIKLIEIKLINDL